MINMSESPSKYSRECSCALISLPVNNLTTFHLAFGETNRMQLTSDMIINPNIEAFQQYQDTEHDNTLSLLFNNKYVYLKAASKNIYNKWHKAIRYKIILSHFTNEICLIISENRSQK